MAAHKINVIGNATPLETSKKDAKKIARELGYPNIVQDLIDKASGEHQISRILADARHGEYDKK